jgi:hypothetical protein
MRATSAGWLTNIQLAAADKRLSYAIIAQECAGCQA